MSWSTQSAAQSLLQRVLVLLLLVVVVPVVAVPAGAVTQADADRSAVVNQHVRINPFARPLKKAPVTTRRGTTVVEKPAQLLQLRGVLNAGKNSFANVDGTIVGLGEQVGDLTLISVGDGEAVFKRNAAAASRRGAASTIKLVVRSAENAAGIAAPASAAPEASVLTGEPAVAARQTARVGSGSQYVQASEQ